MVSTEGHCASIDAVAGNIERRCLHTPAGPVEYADLGSGPVVVALHGAMGGYDQSAILARTVLDDGFRVLAVSRPGYLGTPLSSGKSPEEQADLVAALLDSLEIARASVVAVSGGGPCALTFGLRHAGRCAGLVLISTVGGKNNVRIPFMFHLMNTLARVPFVVRTMKDKALGNFEQTAARSISKKHILRKVLADEEARELFVALTASTFDRMAERVPGTGNDIRITQTTEYPLEEIQAPTLIVHGTDDPLVRFEQHARSLAARIPHAQLLAVPEGEHVAIFTHRELVRSRVVEFLRAL